MGSRTSSVWVRRGERLLVVAGAVAAVSAVRSRAIDRQTSRHPHVLDPSLPVPPDPAPVG